MINIRQVIMMIKNDFKVTFNASAIGESSPWSQR
jgi:hypothetical protein